MIPIDSYGRTIDYLRVAVTDRCNLRCVYCMPADGIAPKARTEILRSEQIVAMVRAAASLGIGRIRLTGGEPLVRRGIVDLARDLAELPGVTEVALTTNGSLLEANARELARVGVARVNVSLDTLRPERYRRITRLR